MGTAYNYLNALIAYLRGKGNGDRDGAQHRLLAPPSREDVLHAFHLILGREPENEAAISAHARITSVAELRRVLLNSDEFKGKYKAMHPDVFDHPYRNLGRPTVVMIHLQKTGGTSLRDIIGSHFSPDRRCPILENKLHVLSIAELARYDFFAGHYDISSIRFIPRDNIFTVCIFREPRARLISFYRFLRSHPSGDEFAGERLIQLAHLHNAEDFFSLQEIRAYSAINNHYSIALGRSFVWFDDNRDSLSRDVMESVLLDAKLHVSALTALGLTERFAPSVKLICHQLEMPEPLKVKKKHETDKFASFDARFRRVEPVKITSALNNAMRDLIVYDDELYAFAVREFELRNKREFGSDPLSA